eukprot:gb/GECH01006462.1/.p1 GENE.gb/GECH01006462.1/~~gb/GECH01006462.1/.p1  ORF type:complete len:166 (+),score=46.43 gb/GECH01006462.1/:1-498(+)
MDKSQPVLNKICYKKDKKREHQRHRKKLANMKPAIDNGPPQRFSHLEDNKKRKQIKKERQKKIDEENALLMKKVNEIHQKPSQIDCHNENAKPKSLHKDFRKRQQKQIEQENIGMLSRILEQKPNYDHKDWEKERIANEERAARICEYDYKFGVTGKVNPKKKKH